MLPPNLHTHKTQNVVPRTQIPSQLQRQLSGGGGLGLSKLGCQRGGNAQRIRHCGEALDQEQRHLSGPEHTSEHGDGELQNHMLLRTQVVAQLDHSLMSLSGGWMDGWMDGCTRKIA
jgi:hypothetical protein